MRKINPSEIRFTDFPEKKSLDDYKETSKKIYFGVSKSLYSLYAWGSISNPGISDLDLMLVLKSEMPLKHKTMYFMDKKSRYIAVHPFIIADKFVAENAMLIYPDTDFSVLFGSKINFKRPKKQDINSLRCCLLNDIIIRHLPRDFFKIQNSKIIKVRELLLRLNSFSYSLNLYASVTKKRIAKADEYKKGISDLRSNWFSLSRQQQETSITELYNNAFKLSLEIVEGFSKYLDKNNLAKIRNCSKISYSGDKNKTIFLKGWKKSGFSNDYVNLPLNLAAQLACYSNEKGVLSNYIKNNLNPKSLNYEFKYKDTASKRIMILNHQASLADTYRHLHFPAFFDFGYRPSKGLVNKMARFVYKTKKFIA